MKIPARFKPQPAKRFPVDPRIVFFLGLLVVSGIPLLVGRTRPESLNDTLPTWGVVMWGFCLVVGSGLSLAGMTRKDVDGVLLEQVGTVMVGAAALLYGVAMVLVNHAAGAWPGALTGSFGLAFLLYWGQLQAHIQDLKHTVDAQRHKDDLEGQ